LPASDLRGSGIGRSTPLGGSRGSGTPVTASRSSDRGGSWSGTPLGLGSWWSGEVGWSGVGVGGGLTGGGGLLELLLGLLRITVEEEVDDNVPRLAGDGATKAEDLTGEHPVHETDGVAGLVVGWDGNVDETEWGVGITESDDWDVHVTGLTDWLVVGARVGEHEKTWLLEVRLDLIGESTRGETSSNVGGAGVLGVLEHGTLTVWTGRDDTDISWVLDGHDDAGSEHELLPGLGEVDHVDTCEVQKRLVYRVAEEDAGEGRECEASAKRCKSQDKR